MDATFRGSATAFTAAASVSVSKYVVRALTALLDEPKAEGDVFNVGSSEEISIEELAKLVIARTASSSELVHLPYDVAYEAGFEDMAKRVPDVSKVRELTGWKAERRLADVLDDVISEVRAEYALPRRE